MDFLQPLAEDETVRAIARSAFESGHVHGVALELDDFWAWAETARWTLDEADLQSKLHDFRYWIGHRGLRPPYWIDIDWPVSPAPVDMDWKPSWFDELVGRPWSQIVVVVSILPDRLANARQIQGQLDEIAGSTFRVELRVTPVPTLFSGAQLAHEAVTSGIRTGTTGGVLDIHGKHVLAGSAHVCAAGEPVRVGDATGTCAFAENLVVRDALPAHEDFDDAPRTDIALLAFPDHELARSPRARGLARPAPSNVLRQGISLQPLVPRHRVRTLIMAQYSVAQCFRIDGLDLGGTWALYRDLFTMRLQSERWTDRAFEIGVSRGGDSGAWVARHGPDGLEWAGSIVGGEPPLSYAAYASRSLLRAGATVVPPGDLVAIAS